MSDVSTQVQAELNAATTQVDLIDNVDGLSSNAEGPGAIIFSGNVGVGMVALID